MSTENEAARLESLASFSILDTLPEEDYDNLTAIAAEICGTRISLVSLLDDRRQWFKSHHGLEATETPKEYAFCAHAIQEPRSVFVIPDARLDERFHDNPLVTGDPYVIFYAGVPLVTDEGQALGTLCVIDKTPKLLSQGQVTSLKALAKQVMKLLELRKKSLELEESLHEMESLNKQMEQFAFVAAHDLRSPLNIISNRSKLFQAKNKDKLDLDTLEFINTIEASSGLLRKLVDDLLTYYKGSHHDVSVRDEIAVADFVRELEDLFAIDEKCVLRINSSVERVFVNRTALNQVMLNLLSNAFKYNDKSVAEIEIAIFDVTEEYHFSVTDNGPGIQERDREKVFEAFKVLQKSSQEGEKGHGLGLSTAKRIVQSQSGNIWVDPDFESGAKICFTFAK